MKVLIGKQRTPTTVRNRDARFGTVSQEFPPPCTLRGNFTRYAIRSCCIVWICGGGNSRENAFPIWHHWSETVRELWQDVIRHTCQSWTQKHYRVIILTGNRRNETTTLSVRGRNNAIARGPQQGCHLRDPRPGKVKLYAIGTAWEARKMRDPQTATLLAPNRLFHAGNTITCISGQKMSFILAKINSL